MTRSSSDLRSRIDGYCVRSASYYYGEWTVTASFDGIDVAHSIDGVDRDEVVDVALAGLRIDWVRREIERGTATAADIRVAIEDADVVGDVDFSDLIEAFMLLASEDELDAWRSEKVRRLSDEMDEAEAHGTASIERSSRWKVNVAESYVGALSPTGGPGGTPDLVDAIPLAEYRQSAAETVEVWSSNPALNGTTLVVSTVAEADSFELIVADLLPDDDDYDPNQEPGAMCKRALKKAEADIASSMGVPLSAVSSDFNAPETITLTRDRLTSALREAAAQGMDRTSGQWSGYAASCREIAARIAKDIEAGRFSADDYGYRVESERRVSKVLGGEVVS